MAAYTRLKASIEENFSKTLLLTQVSKFTFLQNSIPFPNTNYELTY